jgi:A/G-specific adenine glycosylase
MDGNTVERFRATVWEFYAAHGRDLPWRRTRDPYLILVSEFMLQQTQVARVIPKYCEFTALFPSIRHLAGAPVADVLRAWQGLGYNRRALNLRRCAESIVAEHGAAVPSTLPALLSLPGVGRSTAAAVRAFAFDEATPFLETNIRSAFIHHFFPEGTSVSDAELLPLVEDTLDHENPREWYYALMDYGSWLKSTGPNPSRRSKHAKAQSPFSGSHRQLRAALVRTVLAHGSDSSNGRGRDDNPDAPKSGLDLQALKTLVPGWDESEIECALAELVREGFLRRSGGGFLPA